MKHRYTILALPVLVCGAIVAGTNHASAVHPTDPDARHSRPVTVQPEPPTRVLVEVDDTATEALQTAAGAFGGAGLVTAGLWLYRRRHPLAAH